MAAVEPSGKVHYQDLKDWIAKQEAYEASTGKPSPLTPAQSKAIAELSRAAQAPNPNMVNPNVGDEDYVSVLNYFDQCSTGATISYTDGDIAHMPTPLHTSTLKLEIAHADDSPVAFPSTTTSGLIAGSLPCFSRKKDARKYAAQQCVEWLVANGHLLRSSSAPYGYTAPKNARKQTEGKGAPGEEGGSTPQKVEQLCRELNIVVPRYDIFQIDGAGGSLWSGELDWGRDQGIVPEGLGRADKVRGKKACKEQLAVDALVILRRVERERQAELAIVMED